MRLFNGGVSPDRQGRSHTSRPGVMSLAISSYIMKALLGENIGIS